MQKINEAKSNVIKFNIQTREGSQVVTTHENKYGKNIVQNATQKQPECNVQVQPLGQALSRQVGTNRYKYKPPKPSEAI